MKRLNIGNFHKPVAACKELSNIAITIRIKVFTKFISQKQIVKMNMNLDDIFNQDEMSVRCYNICRNYGFKTIQCLRNYYATHHTFLKLNNSGIKSNFEFTQLLHKYGNSNSNNTKNHTEKSISKIISELPEVKRAEINNFIIFYFRKLSTRSQNVILHHLNNDLAIESLCNKKLFNDDYHWLNLKGVGKKSAAELRPYFKAVKNFVNEIGNSDTNTNPREISHHEHAAQNKLLEDYGFQKTTDFEFIFKAVKRLIEKKLRLNEREMLVLDNAFRIYDKNEVTNLDQLGAQLQLNHKRIRELRKLCWHKFLRQLIPVTDLMKARERHFQVNAAVHILEPSEELAHTINEINNTNFSKEFILYIYSLSLYNDFSLIGNLEDVFFLAPVSRRNRHVWKSIYLIRNDQLQCIDIAKMMNELSVIQHRNVKKLNALKFKNYISQYARTSDLDHVLQYDWVEKIIHNEFGIDKHRMG